MKKSILIILILINVSCIYSQDTYNYLPLKTGNTWVYRGYSAVNSCPGAIWYDRYIVTGTILINGKTYYMFSHNRIYVSGNCGGLILLFESNIPIRVDTVTHNIYKNTECGASNETLIDSLKSRLHDTAYSCFYQKLFCTDTSKYNFCGGGIPSKNFHIGEGWDYGVDQRYAKDIGLVSYYYYCGGSISISLRGCIIDGALCGDTTFPVGIQVISTEIPQSFDLEQNYPNPFNPVTNIKFSIPHTGYVKLIVYDLLGKEVEKLVDEQLTPGIYEADFDASKLSSGMYFYQLTAGDYTETKKMVVIK